MRDAGRSTAPYYRPEADSNSVPRVPAPPIRSRKTHQTTGQGLHRLQFAPNFARWALDERRINQPPRDSPYEET